VLGNHDYHCDQVPQVVRVLEDAGIVVLEGDGVVLDCTGTRLGIAGAKGFGGGFLGACGTEFGEREMKAFIDHTKQRADALRAALDAIDADVKVALMHYSPIRETLLGEPPEIFPFLGSYLLAEAVDGGEADIAIHGHAHRGREHGVTPGGVHVRNVAQPVIRQGYAVYEFEAASADGGRARVAASTSP
jgi:Icc-related predicted phosphoesterase